MVISAAPAAWHDILERVNRWRLGARSAAARRRRRAARDWRQAVARNAQQEALAVVLGLGQRIEIGDDFRP
jgi:hypothetical protein